MTLATVSAMRQGGAASWPCLMLMAGAAASLAACAGGPRPGDRTATGGAPTSRYAGYHVGKPYQINGVWYYPKDQPNYDEIGIASWYGEQFHNHYTADGEVFDMHLPSAAHKTLPLPSLVEVTNLANGRTLVVRVNDRGPFVDGRVIDLSREAAAELGFVAAGVTRVRVRYVGHADAPPEPRQYQASNASAPAARPASPATASPRPVQMASTAPAASPAPIPGQTAAAVAPVSQTKSEPPPSADPPAYGGSAAPASSPLSDVDALLADSPPVSAAPAPAPVLASTGNANLQLQAGIFASRANADALASRLAVTGAPQVEPFERNGQTLYRVTVRGFANAGQAAAARSQAAALGAPDARVVAGS